MVAFWLAAEGGVTMGGYSKTGLVSYYVFVMFLQWLVFWNAASYVSQEIKEGEFSTRALAKPASYYWQKFAHELGWHTLSPVYGLTVAGIVLFVMRVGIEVHLEPEAAIFLVAAILLGAVICFSMSMCLGLLAFWLTETAQLNSLLWAGLMVLGGQGIPISFFPGMVRDVIYALPFRYVYSFPAEIFLGQLSSLAVAVSFGVGVAWVGILTFLYRYLWKKGVVAYSSYGG